MLTNIVHVIAYQFPTAIARVDWRAVDRLDGQGPVLTFWNVAKLGAQPSQQTLEDIEALAGYQTFWSQAQIDARALSDSRTAASTSVTSGTDYRDKVARAIVQEAVDEINLLREWIMSFKAAVAAATSLANLQTRVAALSDLPDRTLAQAKTAITNNITNGGAD